MVREIHERTGATPPIDAFELAEACGFTCIPWSKGGGQVDLDRRAIRFPAKARSVHQHGVVAHELGHFVVRRGGEDPRDEDAARYAAGALLIPRQALLADVSEVGLDLFELERRHPNASAQMMSVRLCQVVPDTWAEVWDQGRRHASYGAHAEVTGPIVDRVLETGEPVRGEVSAWPVFDGVYRRVIVLGRAA